MPYKTIVAVKGGPESGNFGHVGRPGLVGGSGGGGAPVGKYTKLTKANVNRILSSAGIKISKSAVVQRRYGGPKVSTSTTGIEADLRYDGTVRLIYVTNMYASEEKRALDVLHNVAKIIEDEGSYSIKTIDDRLKYVDIVLRV